MDIKVKKFLQDNKELINNREWGKLFNQLEYGDISQNVVLNIFQSIGQLEQGIKDIFPGYTNYYTDIDDMLRDLETKIPSWENKRVSDIKQILKRNANIMDIFNSGIRDDFYIGSAFIGSDVDAIFPVIILEDKFKMSQAYISIDDTDFKQNIQSIQEIGVAYNRDKILKVFQKYIDLVNNQI